jgi:DNA-binding MarR family transcriptional regulator
MGDEELNVFEGDLLDHEGPEQHLLDALLKKGPALPVELAVRTYSFPEEIAEPLDRLEQRGLVARQSMRTGQMIVLTEKGQAQAKKQSMK